MTTNLLDQIEKKVRINHIHTFGIGLFFALALYNYNFIFKNICREILMSFDIHPHMNFWITECFILLTISLITWIQLHKMVKLVAEKSSKFLIYTFGLFIASVVLKFIFRYYILQMQILSKQIRIYNRYIIDSEFYQLLFQIFEVLTYIILLLLIIKFSKKHLESNLDANS